MKNTLLAFLLPGLCACTLSHQHQLILPDKTLSTLEWTSDELKQPIAVRTLYRNPASSTHLVRLNANELPHFHDRHNLAVTVLSGQSRIHFRDRTIEVSPGDSISIPQGTYHWAEKTGDQACIISVTFSPAFDGKDRRTAE